jgi:hypothetical protein
MSLLDAQGKCKNAMSFSWQGSSNRQVQSMSLCLEQIEEVLICSEATSNFPTTVPFPE